jgi:hypothetical protein
MMLATWLVEFYLSRCDELDDLIALSSYGVENVKTELEEDVRRFLESHKVSPLFDCSGHKLTCAGRPRTRYNI